MDLKNNKKVELLPYQERMVEEYRELNDRIVKLNAFLENKEKLKLLGSEQHSLMVLQVEAMEHYRHILQMRMLIENISIL